MILQEVPLVRDLLSLRSDVCDFPFSHVVDDHRRERLLSKIVRQMALNDLLGGGGDDVLDFVLRIVSRCWGCCLRGPG